MNFFTSVSIVPPLSSGGGGVLLVVKGPPIYWVSCKFNSSNSSALLLSSSSGLLVFWKRFCDSGMASWFEANWSVFGSLLTSVSELLSSDRCWCCLAFTTCSRSNTVSDLSLRGILPADYCCLVGFWTFRSFLSFLFLLVTLLFVKRSRVLVSVCLLCSCAAYFDVPL